MEWNWKPAKNWSHFSFSLSDHTVSSVSRDQTSTEPQVNLNSPQPSSWCFVGDMTLWPTPLTASNFNWLQASITAVLVTGPTVMHDSPFFPSGGWNHSQYSFWPTHSRDGSGWLDLDAQFSVLRWFTCPKTRSSAITERPRDAACCRVFRLVAEGYSKYKD